MEDVDKQRKDEFKEYEMKKELQYEEQLKRMDEKNRAEAEKFHKQQQEKHRVGSYSTQSLQVLLNYLSNFNNYII